MDENSPRHHCVKCGTLLRVRGVSILGGWYFLIAGTLFFNEEERKDRLNEPKDENQRLLGKMQYYPLQQDSPTRKPSAAEEIEQQAEEVSRVKITPME